MIQCPDRRSFLHLGSLSVLALVAPWRARVRAEVPLGDPDELGVRLPPGYRARLLAVSGQNVPATAFPWHSRPDGGATFPTDTGGWIYVSNSEDNGNQGGTGAIRFDNEGQVADAYRVLDGLKWACAGGITPWGTWLACEETHGGYVWECDPSGTNPSAVRRALGRFPHEAAVVDPASGYVYETEDDDELSRLYRFRPDRYGDLSSGRLEAASVSAAGLVTWVTVPNDRPYRGKNTTPFARLEGAWFDPARRTMFFTTTSDSRVWALNVDTGRLRIIYDGAVTGGPLLEPDNITLQSATGDLFVAEDNDNLELVRFVEQYPGGPWTPSVFLQLVGHDSSEVAGPALSPDGRRLYFSSQRGRDGKTGLTFAVTRLDGGLI